MVYSRVMANNEATPAPEAINCSVPFTIWVGSEVWIGKTTEKRVWSWAISLVGREMDSSPARGEPTREAAIKAARRAARNMAKVLREEAK